MALPPSLSYDQINQQLQPLLDKYNQIGDSQKALIGNQYDDLAQRLRQQNTLDSGQMLTSMVNGNQGLSGGVAGQQAFLNQQTQNQLNRADIQRTIDQANIGLQQYQFGIQTGSQLGQMGLAQQGLQQQQQQLGINQGQVLNDILKNPFLHYLQPQTAQALLSSLGVNNVSGGDLISGMPDPNSFLNGSSGGGSTSPTPSPAAPSRPGLPPLPKPPAPTIRYGGQRLT